MTIHKFFLCFLCLFVILFLVSYSYYYFWICFRKEPNTIQSTYPKENYNVLYPRFGFLEDHRILDAMKRLEQVNRLDNIRDQDGNLMVPKSLIDMCLRGCFELKRACCFF